MRALTVDVKSSTGRILCCTVFRPGGKKLLAKGHVISDEDVCVLESEGMDQIWVTELEEGEIGEDEAVSAVAGLMGCGSFEIRMAAGGRANLIATENCCVLVDDELLRQINCTASIVIATSFNFTLIMSLGAPVGAGHKLSNCMTFAAHAACCATVHADPKGTNVPPRESLAGTKVSDVWFKSCRSPS